MACSSKACRAYTLSRCVNSYTKDLGLGFPAREANTCSVSHQLANNVIPTLQAVADLHEQHIDLVSGKIKSMLDPKKQSAGLSAGDPATAPGGARPSHGGAPAKLQVGLLYLSISAGSVLYAVSICAVQSAVQGVPEIWLRCSVSTCTYALLYCSFEHRDKAAFASCLGAVMFSAAAQDESASHAVSKCDVSVLQRYAPGSFGLHSMHKSVGALHMHAVRQSLRMRNELQAALL